MSSKPTTRPIYNLDSEVALLKRKFPAFDLQLPAVRYTQAERELDRAEWDEQDHLEGEEYKELGEFKQDAQTISVQSIAFMDDDIAALSTRDAPSALRQHIGDENYEKYVTAGGTAQILFQIMQQDQQAHQGE